jgi:hypothetical protein
MNTHVVVVQSVPVPPYTQLLQKEGHEQGETEESKGQLMLPVCIVQTYSKEKKTLH